MASLCVHGGKPLSGSITPSGNKNAVLPIFCATLLTDETVILRNVPNITDVQKLVHFFETMGSQIEWDREEGVLRVDHSHFRDTLEGVALPEGMRSAVLLLPALLRRVGTLECSNTKGCALGSRELDPHLEALHVFGATVSTGEPIRLTMSGRYRGGRLWQDYMSVTTTENFLMAAALAEGESALINAASEPHVQDLCQFLIRMGADVEGVGSSLLRIRGVDRLHGTETSISPDHHEITTFLALGAITGGEVKVETALPHHFDLINRSFDKLGVHVRYDGHTAIVGPDQSFRVKAPYTANLLPRIEAAPWPYFPVDLLPLMIALATRVDGIMMFWNKVYDGGYSWIPELTKYGAHVVTCDPHRIIVFGNRPLRPAVVEAPYIIRAAVALYMVAASIPGASVIKGAESIQRAHPRFVENLQRLGADVEWDDLTP
ncbi:MAG: UDP-N-acetylglucosamine 1-carboxyvinyltransferase [candidate division Zixibacteria bacterium]|nr:UDP-N-acetylglucosamine 1-carboxyvinyltransferase [candidate division Zixibacteria bacterium]